jgi:hypothetical protein
MPHVRVKIQISNTTADQLALQQLTEQSHEALAIHSGQPHPQMSDLVAA